MRSIVQILLLLAAAGGTACSPASIAPPNGGADGGEDGGRDVSEPEAGSRPDAAAVKSVCAMYGRGYCDFLNSCSPSSYLLQYGNDNDLICAPIHRQICENALEAPGTAATLASYQSCIDQLNPTSWSCADFLESANPPMACKPSGSLGNGGACTVPEQCASDFCAFPPGSTCGQCEETPTSCTNNQCAPGYSCLAGQCVAPAIGGQVCGANQPCKDGFACVSSGGGMRCQPSGADAGVPCSITGVGTPDCNFYLGLGCNVMTQKCVSEPVQSPGQGCGIVEGVETYCTGGSCVDGVCVASLPMGAACTLDGVACVSGTVCIVGADGGTRGTCQVRGSSICP